ncbi:MAG: Asp23/Gls24 family envelope stress response protein [Clostridia bacterium]
MFDKIKSSKGRTTYNDSIITKIVTLAVCEVEGVAPITEVKGEPSENADKYLQKVKFDLDKDELLIELSIYVYYGYSVPDVAFKVQEAVFNGIENMTSYKLTSVDVTVLGVVTPNEE